MFWTSFQTDSSFSRDPWTNCQKKWEKIIFFLSRKLLVCLIHNERSFYRSINVKSNNFLPVDFVLRDPRQQDDFEYFEEDEDTKREQKMRRRSYNHAFRSIHRDLNITNPTMIHVLNLWHTSYKWKCFYKISCCFFGILLNIGFIYIALKFWLLIFSC